MRRVPPSHDRSVSALPSTRARAVAFLAIIVGGICGALIGWSLVSIQCSGACAVPEAAGTITGGVIAAGGVAIVAVLALRAMGEWRRIQEDAAD